MAEDEPDFRAAVHEVGHAILHWESPYAIRPLPKRQVLVVDGDRSRFQFRDWPQSWLRPADKIWDEILIRLGGLAAEHVMFPNPPDRPRSEHFLSDVVNRLATLTSGPTTPDPSWLLDRNAPPPWFADELKLPLRASEALSVAWTRSCSVVTDRHVELAALASLLAREQQLSSLWLRRILGPRRIDRA